MKRLLVFAFIIALAPVVTAGSEEKFTVSGFGGYPISASLTSMWLAAPDHRPLLMVYFHGPEGWHNTQWKVASKFEKGKPGRAELQSERATLHLSMNTETEFNPPSLKSAKAIHSLSCTPASLPFRKRSLA